MKPFGNIHCLQYCFMPLMEIEMTKLNLKCIDLIFSPSCILIRQPILPLVFHAVPAVNIKISNSLLVCSLLPNIALRSLIHSFKGDL